jgi:uncharacterized protein (TIGR02453 family)
MSHFDKSFVDFFKQLSANNTSAWFADNRKTYETSVKNPFKAFVDEMITRIQKHQPEINISSSDAIFRINKDIRFSKDKTPYNTHVSANVSSQGRKSKEEPGFYFQLSHEGIEIFGGAYIVEPGNLQNLRNHIAQNLKTFAALYNDKNFKEKFGSIHGEKNKKLPDDIKALVDKEPLLANKQFFYSAKIKPSAITQKDLADQLMEYYKAGKKMNDFLKDGLKG